MNHIAKIIIRRGLEITLAIAAVKVAAQKLAGHPLRLRPAESTLISTGVSVYFASLFIGSVRLGYPKLMTRLPKARRSASVALTFDDGPNPETTPQILDILREHGAQATFFLLTEEAAKHPDLVQRIVNEGHTVGLHGITHDALALCTTAQVTHILRLMVRDLGPDIPEPRYFRPPYGFKSHAMQRACNRMGLTLITWSVNPADYFNIDAAEITRRVITRLREGDIVLLHDGRPETVIALPTLLNRIAGLSWRSIRI